MEHDNLVKMVNRIGAFFAAMPDRSEALEGIARHLKNFWEPRMRRALLAHVDQQGGAGIDDVVMTAIREHRALLAA